MIIAGTGHRLDKLGGYSLPNPTYIKVCQAAEKILIEEKPEKVISGMAIGFDQWLANIAIKLNISLIAAVPFINQEKLWNDKMQKAYHKLLDKASEIVIVSEGGYSAQKMQIRNCWMTDHADKILACWDGSAGGTKNCLDYCKSINKSIIRINSKEL